MSLRRTAEGHLLDDKDKFTSKGFIQACYDEYLRMVQLGRLSAVSKRPIKSLTFNQYLIECDKNLEFRGDELSRALILNRVKKNEAEFSFQVIRKSREALKEYFAMDAVHQNQWVYPDEAPTEADMKKRVEAKAEETVQNVNQGPRIFQYRDKLGAFTGHEKMGDEIKLAIVKGRPTKKLVTMS